MPEAYAIDMPITSIAPADTTQHLNALMGCVWDAIDETAVRSALSGSGWALVALGIESQRRGAAERDGTRIGQQTVSALLEPADIEIDVPVPAPAGPGLLEYCIGAWDMKLLSDGAVRDLSGNGNHLSLSASGATLTDYGVALNGSSGYLRAPAFSAGGGVTTSAIAVVRFTSLAAGGSLVHIGADTSLGGSYLLWYAASNAVLYAEGGKSGGYDKDQPSAGLQPVVDSSFRAYGLGLSIGTGAYTTRWWRQETYEAKSRGQQLIAHTVAGLTVGAVWNTSSPRSPYPYYLNGTIAWLSIFNKQLTDAEYQAELIRIRGLMADRGVTI